MILTAGMVAFLVAGRFHMSIYTPAFNPDISERKGSVALGYQARHPGQMFTSRWHVGLRDEEKRQCPRRSLRCPTAMIENLTEADHEPRTVPVECVNVCEDGLYAIVPIGYGVAMGQRFTFRLNTGERGPEPEIDQIVMQQGRVVRTELLLSENGQTDRVGVGVQLIGPRNGMLPMPTMESKA